MSTAGKGVKLKALAEAPETLITEAILTGGIDKLLEGFEEEKRLEQEKLDEQAVVNAKKVYATFTEDEVEVDRIYYPDKSRLIEYLYLHTGRLIPYKAMCPGHNAPAEFIEHILYGETDVLALANRSGGKTMQLGMACGMLVYPFRDRPHGIKTRQLGGCLPTGEYILTRNNGYVQIQHVKKGDLVLGRQGWNKVLSKTSREYKGSVTRVTPTGWPMGTAFTPEHRLWIAPNPKESASRCSGMWMNYTEAKWVETKDVKVHDATCVPTSVDAPEYRVKPFVLKGDNTLGPRVKEIAVDPSSPDWGFVIGSYVAEGSCNARNAFWYWGTDKKNIAAALRLKATLKRLGFNPKIDNKRKNVIVITVGHVALVRYIKKACGGGCAKTKRIPDEFMHHAGNELLQGLWVGDGYDSDRSGYTTVSDVLAGQVTALLIQRGIFPSVSCRERRNSFLVDEKRHIETSESWEVRVSGKSQIDLDKTLGIEPSSNRKGMQKYKFALSKDELSYIGIRKVEKYDYDGTVWNLEVENDPAYGVHALLCHNSSDQSKKIYEEFQNFLENGYYDKVIGDVLQAKTMFEGGGRIELLTQSTRSVRGPHVPRLLLDEIDEFDRPVYNASLLIPQSTVDVKSMIAMASTRHRTYGLMREVFETFKGKRLIWCVFEVMEACTGDYSCSTCNLATYCPGKEKMEHATGYLSVDDARNQRSRVKDDDIYEAEALCRKPRSEGAIYQRLDPALHLVDVAYNPLLPIHKAFDYGTDHPTVLQYFQIVKEEGRYQARCFDELRWRGTAPSVMVREMKAHDAKMGYSVAVHTFVPQDAAGLRAELEDKDIGTSYPKQSVDDGIATIRNLLVADTISKVVGIVWSRTRCRETFKELEMYHADGGKVVKKQDDGPDCSRYFCHSMPELQTMGKPVIAMTTETLID